MDHFTRRSCLLSIGTSALFLMSGCGGWLADGGHSALTGTLKLRSYTGTVTLPAGTDTTHLRVMGPFSTTKIEGTAFKATGAKDFPSPISIVDVLSGKTVMTCMLDPASGAQSLDAANCAATLLFLSLGGSQFFVEDRQTAWTAVAADPTLPPLAGVVEGRLAANLYALEDGDQAIAEALEDAARSAAPLDRGMPRQKALPTAHRTRGTTGASIHIAYPEVGNPVNGADLINHNNQGVSVANGMLREGVARYYLTARTDHNNQTTQIEPPTLIAPPVHVPRKGQTEMVPIELLGDDQYDNFDVIYLAPIFDAPEPEIFSNPAYAGDVASWRAELQRMYQRATIGLVSKVLLEALGVAGIELDSEALDRTIANMQAIGPEAADLVLGAREGTGLSSGVKDLIQLARGSDQGCFDFLAAISPLLEKVHPVLARDLAQRNLKSADLARIRSALRMVSILGAMALSLELGAEYKHLHDGMVGVRFYGAVFLNHVSLAPSGGTYTPGQTVPFTATVQSQETGFTYHWKLTGIANATLDDQNGTTGADFETNQKTVLLKTTAASLGNAVVRVEVFRGTGPDRESVGDAQTTLTHFGGAFLNIEEFLHNGTVYVTSMATIPKPHTQQGGNNYVGGTLRADVHYEDHANQIFETRHYQFIVPPYTGLPGSATMPPQFAGTRILPSIGGGSSTYAGVDCYDLGDRLVLIKIVGQYFPGFSTPEQISQTRLAVSQHTYNTTLSATFP